MKRDVSASALIKRINRKLAPELEAVRKSRTTRMLVDVGQYYIVLTDMNAIGRHDVDIEDLGRELGVLKRHERLVEVNQ